MTVYILEFVYLEGNSTISKVFSTEEAVKAYMEENPVEEPDSWYYSSYEVI